MITTRSFAVLGILLATGLLLFGVQIRSAVVKGRDFDRFLTVRGLSEREVKANLAIWPVRFATYANDLSELRKSMESDRATTIAYLGAYGLTGDQIVMGLPTVTDREDERREVNNVPVQRYKGLVTIVVRSSQVDQVKAAIQHADELLSKGIALAAVEDPYQSQFLFTDLNSIKPEMIREATANARLAAEKFAQDSKAEVGQIRRATQGALEIEDRDPASPEKKILRVVTTVDFFLK